MSSFRLRDIQLSFRSVAMFLFACALFTGSANADQIVNGNFSSGYVGFTTGYTVVSASGSVQTSPGQTALTMNPAVSFTNGYASYTDHTGNSGGLMLFFDGYYAGTNAWAETVSVAPSTTYTFTGWVASAYPNDFAILGLFANGTQIGSSFTAPSSVGVWTQWTSTLTTNSTASSINLAIQDLNPSVYAAGDDFAIDDLSLTGSAPEPSTLALCALALLCCIVVKSQRFGFLRRRPVLR